MRRRNLRRRRQPVRSSGSRDRRSIIGTRLPLWLRTAGCAPTGSTISIERSTHRRQPARAVLRAASLAPGARGLTINDSTIIANDSGSGHIGFGEGGGIVASGTAAISNSTATGNLTPGASTGDRSGAGINDHYGAWPGDRQQHRGGQFLDVQRIRSTATSPARSPPATATTFRQRRRGQRPRRPREHRRPARLRRDRPPTGGGKLSPDGIVPLKNEPRQPGAERRRPVAAERLRPARHRPPAAGRQPARPRRGRDRPAALDRRHRQQRRASPARNAANNLSGLAGNDLTQGPGRQRHRQRRRRQRPARRRPRQRQAQRRHRLDLVTYRRQPAAVVVDLSGTADTAKRGGETDTLPASRVRSAPARPTRSRATR